MAYFYEEGERDAAPGNRVGNTAHPVRHSIAYFYIGVGPCGEATGIYKQTAFGIAFIGAAVQIADRSANNELVGNAVVLKEDLRYSRWHG